MKVFCGYIQDSNDEGACLIFANHLEQTAQLATPVLRNWYGEIEPSEVAVEQLTEHLDYLKEQADQEKLHLGIAHVIESPKGCPNCEMWGGGRPFKKDEDFEGNPIDDGPLVCEICYGWGET